MTTGLGIITYVPHDRPHCRKRLPNLMRSLEFSCYPGPIVIVDDGSTDEMHRDYLDTIAPRHTVIHKPENSGICRAKNTALRVIRDWNVDVGFVVEDDVEFRSPYWWACYSTAHQLSELHHFSWHWNFAGPGEIDQVNGYPVIRREALNGCFLSFTREVLRTVGGFAELPGKYGHTHVNWSRRIRNAGLIPFFPDIVGSENHIGLSAMRNRSPLTRDQKKESIAINAAACVQADEIIHCDFVE